MNILEFINSRDVKGHLKKINYQCSSLQAAWIISESTCVTLKEKHLAWTEIITKMLDCRIGDEKLSLHELLQEQMKIDNEILSEFYENDPHARYAYYYYIEDMPHNAFCLVCEADLIPTYKACYTACLKSAEEKAYNPGSLSHIVVKKKWEGCQKSITAIFSSDFELLNIEPQNVSETSLNLHNVFSTAAVGIPLPFKTGDIIKQVSTYKCLHDYYDDIIVWNTNTLFSRNYSDIGYSYYCMDYTGQLIHEHTMLQITDLEYYRGEFKGETRVLKALSSYLKGDIDIGLYSNAYHTILCEVYAENIRSIAYDESKMNLAGLI